MSNPQHRSSRAGFWLVVAGLPIMCMTAIVFALIYRSNRDLSEAYERTPIVRSEPVLTIAPASHVLPLEIVPTVPVVHHPVEVATAKSQPKRPIRKPKRPRKPQPKKPTEDRLIIDLDLGRSE